MIDPKLIEEVKTTSFGMFSHQNRVMTPDSLGASQSLRGKTKKSDHINEFFPIPEFNTYNSAVTKPKDRRKKDGKAQSVVRQLKTYASNQPKKGEILHENEQKMRITGNEFGTRSRTGHGNRPKLFFNGRMHDTELRQPDDANESKSH